MVGLTAMISAMTIWPMWMGVMIGRAAYHSPYWLATADQQIFGAFDAIPKTRAAILNEFLPYVAAYYEVGGRLNHLTRHMIGLYNGEAGARKWPPIP